MDFRTVLPARQSPFQIDYPDGLLALGSCFAEHIGRLLIQSRFSLILNPFGILYNPVSILQALRTLRSGGKLSQQELFLHQDLWHHFAFHGRFSHPQQAMALQGMNTSLQRAQRQLQHTNHILITWGTAYAYRHQGSQEIVGNCHKLPGQTFERIRLNQDDFYEDYVTLLTAWKAEKPDLQVLLSVSPVRHLRDGLINNQRGKAILLLAAEALTQKLDFVHYFPAYELVLDDLRDYRFYEQDLTHPNDLAVQYVWEFFRQHCFSANAQWVFREIEPVLKAAQHRPFHTHTAAHQQFCAQQLTRIDDLEKKYQFLDLSGQRSVFEAQLARS